MTFADFVKIAVAAVTSFGLGWGANEAISNAAQRERLSFEEAGIFRETVAAGITKESYDAVVAERDQALAVVEQRPVASGIINSGRAVDKASGWITVKERSIIDSPKYQTLTCEQKRQPDSIQLASQRICGGSSVVGVETVYQSGEDDCSATLITVTCAN